MNAGAERAHKTLQLALNHLTPGGFEVGADGIIGPITMHAIETQDPAAVLAEFIVEMIIFYASRPHWHRFKRGWTRRAIRLPKNGKEGEVA